jgi:hypothetical protein
MGAAEATVIDTQPPRKPAMVPGAAEVHVLPPQCGYIVPNSA